ncbi:MAG: FAD-dependent oxidoreductase [Elusimicrobia bacterium]|nr:FAD-dependent oxidoreductase [Elusimicrobiota bacterium]
MKIAIVGSGISGLVCAHYLSRRHEVRVFEAGDYVGGHTNTIALHRASGDHRVDTGFIVFNDWTYPHFIRLIQELGVESQPSSMSFSVHVESTGLEYNGTDLNRLFIQRRNLFRPSFYGMIRDIVRFNREAPTLLDRPGEEITLGQYLSQGGYSREFVNHYIVPMGAAVWSSSVEKMRSFPARCFIQFFKNHGMLSVNDRPQWRVIRGGSRTYVEAITARLKNPVELNTPVTAVRRTPQGVVVTTGGPAGERSEEFDHVILASHSDQSLQVLTDPTHREKEILSVFGYQENRTTLHTDTAVLPELRAAWASWNYRVPARAQGRVAVTYDMNVLQTIQSPETFCVSLNMDDRLAPASVIRKILYHHPVFTTAAVAAQKRWAEISGPDLRTHYAGAYWGYGFHEDGVKSGLRVCESLGIVP